MAKKVYWSQDNAISKVSRSDIIESTVHSPRVSSKPVDAMLYKLYLYVLENTEQEENDHPWGESFADFYVDFMNYFIYPSNN